MFGKKKEPKKRYDPNEVVPVLHKSICTGETTAGFKELKSGKYREVMLIRSGRDLNAFMEEYGVDTVPKTEY